MERIRQLPDGRFVEKDESGGLFFRSHDGALIERLVRNGNTYLQLGLRADFNDRALFNAMDPTTVTDPFVLVWIGGLGKFGTREESNIAKYGSANPSAEQIEKGGYLPPVGEGAGYEDPKGVWPAGEAAAAAPAADPAPAAIPGPRAAAVILPSMAEPSLWQRFVAWVKSLFG